MDGRVAIGVHGPFRMFAGDGTRILLPSRKGLALIAMLALLPGQEHNRDWLRRQLWGSRDEEQAQASFRKELSRLRKLLDAVAPGLLGAAGRRVWLDPSRYDLIPPQPGEQLLEGLEIAGAPDFTAWLAQQRQAAPTRHESDSPPRQPGSLAILPFANESGDVANNYLAAGIGDELADRIARLRWIKIIGSGSSFAVDGGEDVLAAGRRLGASHVFGGRLRSGPSGWLLSGRLLACSDGELICAPALELANPQESNAIIPIIDQLVALLAERLGDAEQVRAAALPADQLAVSDLIWRGRWHQNRLSRPELDQAGQYFADAVQLAPNSANAAIEWTQNLGYRLWNSRADAGEIAGFRDAALRCVDLDRRDGRAHLLVGIAEMWLRDMGASETWLRQAVALCPSLAMAHEQLGTLQLLNGAPRAATDWLEAALRLSPHDFRRFYREAELAMAYLLVDEWDIALARANTAIALKPGYWHAHLTRINLLWRMGNQAGAAEALAQLLAARPGFRISHVDWIPFRSADVNDWLKEPIRQLQDC
jgi:TolB-like protein